VKQCLRSDPRSLLSFPALRSRLPCFGNTQAAGHIFLHLTAWLSCHRPCLTQARVQRASTYMQSYTLGKSTLQCPATDSKESRSHKIPSHNLSSHSSIKEDESPWFLNCSQYQTSSFGLSCHADKRTNRALQANYCSKILNPHLCARLTVRDDTLQT
jgi:hypothetical protein